MNKRIVYYSLVKRIRGDGFTLVEVTVAMAILGGLTALGLSFSSQSVQLVKRNQRLSALEREHAAVRDSALSIPIAAALSAQCDGHPYQRYQPGVPCVPDAVGAPASAGQKAALNALRDAVYRWPEAGILNQALVNPPLDQPYFESTVRPAMISAGCTGCHNGTPNPAMAPDVSGRNFAAYNEIAQPNGTTPLVRAPVASRAIISSRLGRKLLTTNFNTSGVLAGSVQMTPTGPIGVTHFVSFRPLQLTIREMVRNGPLHASGTYANTAANRALYAFVCPGPCPPGQVSEPTTCVRNYTEDNSACPKPKKCRRTTFTVTRDWNCIRYQDFGRDGVNVRVSTVQTDPITGQNRFLSSEGTLQ